MPLNVRRGAARGWLFAGATLLLVALVALYALVGWNHPHGRAARVVIPRGATLAGVSDSLTRAGLVRSARLFRVYGVIRGGARGVKPGTYLFRPGTSWSRMLSALIGGEGAMISITIPEGWDLSQIVPLVAERLHQPVDSVWAVVRDTSLLRQVDAPTPTLEGYLFPDTYSFPPGTSARLAVTSMVRRFQQAWRPAWTARLDTVPLSRHDVITLASIVEREARLPEERPVIAAVYLNRLRTGMRLQADPTVQYALGRHYARLLNKHLLVESPYNTYRHAGLPPGPIGSPGAPSIAAALYPAQVPFRYFVAFPDGHHEFRVTFAQHQVAVAEARRRWKAHADSLAADSAHAAAQGMAPPVTPRPTPAHR